MARRVLANFDTELLGRLGKRSDFDTTQRAQFIHDAYLWVCSSYMHPQLESSTTGTQTAGTDLIVPAAFDIWWYELVKNTDTNRNVYPGDKDEIENREKMPGDPMKYYWWEQMLFTDRLPTVDRNYKLWYIRNVPEMATGESPIIDRLFDPVIIMKAAEIGYSSIRDFKESLGIAGEIDRYVQQFHLPKRMDKMNDQRAGLQPRLR